MRAFSASRFVRERPTVSMRGRYLVALSIGLIVFALRLPTNTAVSIGNDLIWPLCYGRQLLQGQDPYGIPCQFMNTETGQLWPANPLTTALAFLPLTGFSDHLAAAVATGLMYALLAWSLQADGTYRRLLLLLSFPSFWCLRYAQPTPLILAIMGIPSLLPLVLVKPHIGLPVFLTNLTRRRFVATAAFGLVSLAIMPSWPLRWWAQSQAYDGFIPLLTWPGIVFLAVAWFWRDQDARYLIMTALVPQRMYHDALMLAAVLRSGREVLYWTALTWLFVPITIRLPAVTPQTVFLTTTYVPVALCVLVRLLRARQLAAPVGPAVSRAARYSAVLRVRRP